MPYGLNAAAAAGGPENLNEYVMTAGAISGRTGFDSGAVNIGEPIGSLAPSTAYDPNGIFALILGLLTTGGDFRLYMQPSGLADVDTIWREIEMTGTFALGATSPVILQRADRDTYTANDAGETLWEFTTIPSMGFIDGNDYGIILRWDAL